MSHVKRSLSEASAKATENDEAYNEETSMKTSKTRIRTKPNDEEGTRHHDDGGNERSDDEDDRQAKEKRAV